jgi:hypothetical protein
MVEHMRALRWLSLLLAATAVVAIALVAAGVFDPRPVGRLQWRQNGGAYTLPAHGELRRWLPKTIPDAAFSVRVTAVHARGDLDCGYGVMLGENDQSLVAAVSPTGYVAIWRTSGASAESEFSLPWQTWPHVRTGAGAENEIWLDVQGEQAAVRINRELLWQGATAVSGPGVGLWGKCWGETAVIDFRQVDYFGPDAHIRESPGSQ